MFRKTTNMFKISIIAWRWCTNFHVLMVCSDDVSYKELNPNKHVWVSYMCERQYSGQSIILCWMGLTSVPVYITPFCIVHSKISRQEKNRFLPIPIVWDCCRLRHKNITAAVKMLIAKDFFKNVAVVTWSTLHLTSHTFLPQKQVLLRMNWQNVLCNIFLRL